MRRNLKELLTALRLFRVRSCWLLVPVLCHETWKRLWLCGVLFKFYTAKQIHVNYNIPLCHMLQTCIWHFASYLLNCWYLLICFPSGLSQVHMWHYCPNVSCPKEPSYRLSRALITPNYVTIHGQLQRTVTVSMYPCIKVNMKKSTAIQSNCDGQDDTHFGCGAVARI